MRTFSSERLESTYSWPGSGFRACLLLRDAFKIRRIYRKLARRKGSGSLRRITVFVKYENVVRLLRFLGYCLE
jgi:hypothetical protein